MKPTLDDRAHREQSQWDAGQVFEESSRLRDRFHHVFSCPEVRKCEERFFSRMQPLLGGGSVLEVGCYDGKETAELLDFGPKRVCGIDVSQRAIREAQKVWGDQIEFLVRDAKETGFPDDTFDLVVGNSILHHLDFEPAIRELFRIVKPGGAVFFQEPLRDNPASKLFRLMTPAARTPDELPLSRSQIEWADGIFGRGDHIFCSLITTPVAMGTSFLLHSPDNSALRLSHMLDRKLAETPLKYWMRRAYLIWEKQ